MGNQEKTSYGKMAARFLVGLFSTFAVLGVGFVLLIMSAFSTGQRFFIPILLGYVSFLTVWIWLRVFCWPSRKFLRRVFGFALVTLLVLLGGYFVHAAYHSRFDVVVEQEPDLRDYMPFFNAGRLATLDAPASLRLKDDALPRLDGATALYPVYAAFVQAVYPEREYDYRTSDVRCSKTGAAYDRLIAGETDIIFVARPSHAHLDMARTHGVELHLTPIGREAFVFFVNQRNPVTDITAEQVRDIYAGNITNWREIGGRDQEILAFQRPENSGSQTMLQYVMEGYELMDPPTENVVGGMGGIIARAASYRNYPNALGYTFHYFATRMMTNQEVRLLAIDGVSPKEETIRDESYPFADNFYAVTTDSDNPTIEAFLTWMLTAEGQALVQQSGYTPILSSEQ